MQRLLIFTLTLGLVYLGATMLVSAAEPATADEVQWRIGDMAYEVDYDAWDHEGRVVLGVPSGNLDRTPHGEVTRAYLLDLDGEPAGPLTVTYNADATDVRLLRPAGAPETRRVRIMLEDIDANAGQYRNGRIVFSARHAKVHGETAKLESQPGNERIGFWSNPRDFVTWDYTATRPGRYDVFLTYSCAEKSGSKIRVEVGKQQFDATLSTTPHGWYGYTWMKVGTVSIPAAGPLTVAVRATEMVGGAVMNLKALTLIPACEGTPPVQAADGSVTLHARDVTIHGVQAQYEPKPEKNTIGYWTRVTDRVSWEFTITKPGEFDVELLQGCGKGQGGSRVVVAVFASDGAEYLQVTVKDTGHFQNFVARNIGSIHLKSPGKYRLVVLPYKRTGAALMDLRQIRLLPK